MSNIGRKNSMLLYIINSLYCNNCYKSLVFGCDERKFQGEIRLIRIKAGGGRLRLKGVVRAS